MDWRVKFDQLTESVSQLISVNSWRSINSVRTWSDWEDFISWVKVSKLFVGDSVESYQPQLFRNSYDSVLEHNWFLYPCVDRQTLRGFYWWVSLCEKDSACVCIDSNKRQDEKDWESFHVKIILISKRFFNLISQAQSNQTLTKSFWSFFKLKYGLILKVSSEFGRKIGNLRNRFSELEGSVY